MALIHHNNLAVYAGVSRQSVELRPESQCQDMLNCYPTVQLGIRRRNPTQLISNSILVEDNQFFYSYDRGLSGETEEQYAITIDKTNGLRVLDVISNTYRTVTYSGNALKYLESSNPEIGFSAITIKDTTFIANRDVVPLRQGEYSTAVNYSLLTNNMTGYTVTGCASNFSSLISKVYNNSAPARIKIYNDTGTTINSISSIGATTTVVVDGVSVSYTTAVINNGIDIYPEDMYSYRINLANILRDKLSTGYKVSVGLNGEVYIYKLDGTAIVTTSSISFPSSVIANPPVVISLANRGWVYVSETNYGTNPITITGGATTKPIQTISDYNKKAFVWIKQVSVDTTFPYTFTVTLKESNGTTIASTTSNATTSNGVATAIQTWATALADFTAVVDGSVVKITRDSGATFDIVVSDTFGSQASVAWKGSIKEIQDLPKSFPFKDTIVKIDGVQTLDNVAYWVKYDGNQWVESKDPNMLSIIDGSTMPHKLVRNADYTFTLQEITWDNILVGDENSQTIPEFFGSSIKDLFFVNGRLGILTKNGISLSQQGQFYNFFRTTVLSLLDDSAISTYIDSSKSVGLEYAIELQGSIIIFGDKLQFELDGSKGIAPSTISVKPISGFDINKNVKPISSGDSVFFVVSNSGYSSLMEMNKNTLSSSIRAIDVSAHVPTYIDSDIIQLVSSQRDNAIFLRSRNTKDTIYLYKYYGSDTEKVQMAWSKWTFDMNIKSIFVFNKELFLFGLRYNSTVPAEEFSLATTWNDSKIWIDETYWVDGSILSAVSFEKISIEPYSIGADFRDVGSVRYNSEVELSRWLLSSKDTKEMRGSLLIKTAEIVSEPNSSFYLRVEDIERNTVRSIPSIYTVDRKPFISGNANNMKIKIISSNGSGFQINAISLEGQYNVRSKRI